MVCTANNFDNHAQFPLSSICSFVSHEHNISTLHIADSFVTYLSPLHIKQIFIFPSWPKKRLSIFELFSISYVHIHPLIQNLQVTAWQLAFIIIRWLGDSGSYSPSCRYVYVKCLLFTSDTTSYINVLREAVSKMLLYVYDKLKTYAIITMVSISVVDENINVDASLKQNTCILLDFFLFPSTFVSRVRCTWRYGACCPRDIQLLFGCDISAMGVANLQCDIRSWRTSENWFTPPGEDYIYIHERWRCVIYVNSTIANS